ncbi:MAG: histidinol dehydrogenase [Clostridia bacterium]|nr:histidinol dehydrogenase [Clostridia bacterium]
MIKIIKSKEVGLSDIVKRISNNSAVTAAVETIVSAVRREGDKALYDFTERFDKVKLDSLRVSAEEIKDAVERIDKEFIRILKRAYDNITEYHSAQKRTGFVTERDNGVILGQKVIPLARVGIYVPGGTAAYPSTVLMDSIPAKIAGCREIIMVTPPDKTGKVNPAILAAASVAGIDTIFKIGGAQAIAALAYGTETVPKVDKIVGPGNAYVAEAKKQVYGEVSIDMIAGPSEILIIADKNSNPAFVAADMLSQAEHDKMATAILITESEELAYLVRDELENRLAKLERSAIARASIDDNGRIIIVPDLAEAVKISNDIAPEHLELCVDDPFALLDDVVNAGSVFMGRYCPEPFGDYMAGPNHTLPTSGTARFSSPLSIDDFIKTSQFTYFTKNAFDSLAPDVEYFAKKEGLTAHAASVSVRREEKK